MKVLIPAAGLGTRLYPITKYIPKPLLPLDSYTTVLDNIINNLLSIKLIKFDDIVVGIKSEDYIKFTDRSPINSPRMYLYSDKLSGYEHSGFNDLIEMYKKYGKNEDVFILSADHLISRQDLFNFVNQSLQHSKTIPHKNFDYARIAYIKDNDENHILNAGQLFMNSDKSYGEEFVYNLHEKPGKILSKKVACSLYYIPANYYSFVMSYLNSYMEENYKEFGDIINVLLKYDLKIATYKIRDYWIDIGEFSRWMQAIEIFNK